ncbi:hypothetical protein [Terricaulis sp.]|uniref:hypothetical protein n=1 Tax=Terricaulis sp. TaxID=2768686 RepID=UPI0037848230
MAVTIVFSADAAERAAALREQLAALGHAVETAPAPVRLSAQARGDAAASIHRAPAVVVLWSRGATSGLRAFAQVASRARKLVMVRLDGARPPFRADADLRSDSRRAIAALRAALTPRAQQPRQDGTTRGEGVFIAMVFVCVGLTTAYLGNAPFASRVNHAAAAIRAAAASVCGCAL